MTSIAHHLRVLSSVVASTLTGWRGTMAQAAPDRAQPEQPLRLYDIEASPYCRSVREALTALHLDADIRPCPKQGSRFRPEAEQLGGKQQFPLLVDPNTGTVMYESRDIVDYLFRTYGEGHTPARYSQSALKTPLSMVSTAVEALRGRQMRANRAPAQPLELWSFESSPYSRLVRERLCELELPYRLHNVGKEHWTELGPAKQRLKPGPYQPIAGGKRAAFLLRAGRVQVPYLEDPNTGTMLFESADILAYLDHTYGLAQQAS